MSVAEDEENDDDTEEYSDVEVATMQSLHFCMGNIRKLFKPEAQVTVVIRHPKHGGDSDGILLTDEDSPDEVERLIQLVRKMSPH